MAQRNFLQLDQQARTPEARSFCQTPRKMVASDSTYERVLPLVSVAEVAALQRQVARGAHQMGLSRTELPGGRKVRLGIVDGTVLSGRFVSALDVPGAIDTLVDVEPFAKKGDELAATDRLLRRQLQIEGPGFVDYVLGDGLYITQEMIRLCQDDLKVHLVVKSKEAETLNILKDANALFDTVPLFAGVEHVHGVDPNRRMAYEVWAAGGFEHQGISHLKVARVLVRPVKDPKAQAEIFWVISTDESLAAEAMRELGHQRWSIENVGFKALNALAGSKHQWVQKGREGLDWTAKEKQQSRKQREAYFEVVVRLLMIAYTLVQAYRGNLDPDGVRGEYGAVRVTLVFISRRLLQTMGVARIDEGEVPGS